MAARERGASGAPALGGAAAIRACGGHGILVTLTATEPEIRAVLVRLRRQLAMLGLPPGDCGTLELVLAEALNNIAEHAYAGTAGGAVRLRMRLGPGAIIVWLRDRGRPMPGHAAPRPALPETGTRRDALPEGGFGWGLIHDLTTALRYRRREGENSLVLQIPRRA